MSMRRLSSRLQRILHSLATRVPKIVLHRAEDIFPSLHTSLVSDEGDVAFLAECSVICMLYKSFEALLRIHIQIASAGNFGSVFPLWFNFLYFV